jgi:RimJ/RimL family protein N-acetyltransferase
MKIILETPRLRLREFTVADAQLIYDLNSDPEVIKYVADHACSDLAAARQVIETVIQPQYAKHQIGRWAVELKENDECIGWCGLKYLDNKAEYDLGYRFFKKHWGKGFATESAVVSLRFGHLERKLKRIIAVARVENSASLHVLEKTGMKFLAHDFECDGKVAIYVSEQN